MAWSWTGFKYDPVFRFKDKDFFQPGQSQAEARFWKIKIHEEQDRRGIRSSINLVKEEGNLETNVVVEELDTYTSEQQILDNEEDNQDGSEEAQAEPKVGKNYELVLKKENCYFQAQTEGQVGRSDKDEDNESGTFNIIDDESDEEQKKEMQHDSA